MGVLTVGGGLIETSLPTSLTTCLHAPPLPAWPHRRVSQAEPALRPEDLQALRAQQRPALRPAAAPPLQALQTAHHAALAMSHPTLFYPAAPAVPAPQLCGRVPALARPGVLGSSPPAGSAFGLSLSPPGLHTTASLAPCGSLPAVVSPGALAALPLLSPPGQGQRLRRRSVVSVGPEEVAAAQGSRAGGLPAPAPPLSPGPSRSLGEPPTPEALQSLGGSESSWQSVGRDRDSGGSSLPRLARTSLPRIS